MKKPIQVITLFVLEKAEKEAPARRIELYLALAELAPTPEERQLCEALAHEVIELERNQRHLEFLITSNGDSNGAPPSRKEDVPE